MSDSSPPAPAGTSRRFQSGDEQPGTERSGTESATDSSTDGASTDGASTDGTDLETAEKRRTDGVELTRRPTKIAGGVSIGAIVIATAAVVATSATGGLLAVAGVGLVAVGLFGGRPVGRRRLVDYGSLATFAGVVVAGLEGAAIEPTLLATVAVVVAWDLGGSAIDLGEQLGREADTRRLEVVHAVSSALVGLATVTVGFGTYAVAAGGQPVGAVVLLLLAATFATLALGTRP
ncbi:DUF7519 family protein [Natrarchaeobius oligotrophus]|uniref:DUF7519 family protein n=1 Tax=Natrarchaeobius oligotrophus TaxID=3455743 RepID=UPI001A9D8366|nr:hypothetical protein [Natrarchaeobius chitinivorans]